MLQKTHNHMEMPYHDHYDDLAEQEIQDAVDFYADQDRLDDMAVATSQELKAAWSGIDLDVLASMKVAAVDINDKEVLEKLEAKLILKAEKLAKKEAAKANLPSKSTSANLAKMQKKLRKGKQIEASGSSSHDRPITPPPPPPNQLQNDEIIDIEKTPTKGMFWLRYQLLEMF